MNIYSTILFNQLVSRYLASGNNNQFRIHLYGWLNTITSCPINSYQDLQRIFRTTVSPYIGDIYQFEFYDQLTGTRARLFAKIDFQRQLVTPSRIV